MSIDSFVIALVVCAVVIGLSIFFIAKQLKQIRLRTERIEAGETRLHEERAKRIDSIRILMRAVEEDEKLTWTEASIRVKNLLDQLGLDLSQHEHVQAIYTVEQNTQHIPTHDQWNDLPLKARRQYRDEMDALIAQHIEQLRLAKQALLEYKFEE